jgi:thioredoxin-like negative regulator of GroEL
VLVSVALALLLTGPAHRPATAIHWEKGFEEALRRARKQRKPVFVDFWAEWCTWCHRLDQTTYVDPEVVRLAGDFVSVKVDTEGGPQQAEIAARYDVATLPTMLFLSPEGRLLLRVNGFRGPGQFPESLRRARETARQVMAWEAALQKDSNDASALVRLGTHLFEQETYEESRTLLAQAIELDRQSPLSDRKKARMLLGIIQTYDRRYADAEAVLKQALELPPQADHDPRLLFVLGRTYVAWGKLGMAREVMRQILMKYSASPVAGKARETLAALEKKDRRK